MKHNVATKISEALHDEVRASKALDAVIELVDRYETQKLVTLREVRERHEISYEKLSSAFSSVADSHLEAREIFPEISEIIREEANGEDIYIRILEDTSLDKSRRELLSLLRKMRRSNVESLKTLV